MKVKVQGQGVKIRTPIYRYFRIWAEVTIKNLPYKKMDRKIAIIVRFTDLQEIIRLNTVFKKKIKATNILSFPNDTMGDIAICPSVVNREAREMGVEILSYWSHIFIHGLLHLFGFDHRNEKDAEVMEALEKKILFEIKHRTS